MPRCLPSLRSALVVRIAAVLFLLAAGACSPSPPLSPPAPPRVYSVNEVFAHEKELIGKTIAVDIYESLMDFNHYSSSEEGQWTVWSGERPEFQLVGKTWDPAQPKKPVPGLPQKIDAPVRVVGELVRDTIRGERSNRDWLMLRVARLEPLAWPEPEHLPSPAELALHPERWDGHYVECEGDYFKGFEVSLLEPNTWLRQHYNVVLSGFPPPPRGTRASFTSRVRVVGFAYASRAKEKVGYGHLNSYPTMIVANRLTYLTEPKRFVPKAPPEDPNDRDEDEQPSPNREP